MHWRRRSHAGLRARRSRTFHPTPSARELKVEAPFRRHRNCDRLSPSYSTVHTSVAMSQRTAGGLVRCPRGPNTQELSGQELSGRVEHPHTLVLADHFRVRGSHMRAVPSRCPMLLSLGTLADPAPSFPEANSTHATHAFLSLQFIAAPTMTPHHDGMACAPRAGPNLFAAKVPLMLNPPPRRAHDGAPSASRRPRLRRPLRRHLRRQRPRWWRPQRGAAAAARRAGWRCGYRVRYTRRS
jgi:hypothetical protein